VGATNMVTEAALTEAVLDRIPKGTEEKNQKALSLGLALGKAQHQ
jgi:2-oxoglutarate ferredoxin oxidoreductase subunit gamma